MMLQSPAQILIVDDEEPIRTTLKALLQRCGYQVAVAAGGEQALTYLARYPVDLVLLDLIMPGMSGLDVATCTRALRPGAAILLLTGSNRLDELDHSRLPYLEKTAPPETVLERIAALLSASLAARPAEHTPPRQAAMLESFTHDVRNVLMIIQGSAKLIARHIDSASPSERAIIADRLDVIDTAVSQINHQLAQLGGNAVCTPRDRPTDLVALARRIAAAHQTLNPNHSICIEASSARIAGEWNRVGITRALDNLVSNAVKYSPAGGPIVVQLATEPGAAGDWVVVRVCDRGIGIPADALDRIFMPAYRAANVPAKSTGQGMGLASVCRLVAAEGGFVQVQSQERVGSCFTLRLPCRHAVALVERKAICAPLS